MTKSQQKKYQKEILDYLDLETKDLFQFNKVLGISQLLDLNVDCMIFAYALGLANRQSDVIWEKIMKQPINNYEDTKLAIELRGVICLRWAEQMCGRKNKVVRGS